MFVQRLVETQSGGVRWYGDLCNEVLVKVKIVHKAWVTVKCPRIRRVQGCMLDLHVLAAVGAVDDDVKNVVCMLACPGRLRTAASVASSLKHSAYMSHGCQSVFAQSAGVVIGLSVVVGSGGKG